MEKKKFFKSDSIQTVITSLICCLIGLFFGFLLLLAINPEHAFSDGIVTVIKSFFGWASEKYQIKYLGYVLSKSAPLFITGASILFAYKAGLFNIGASGQYTVGAVIALMLALIYKLPWWICCLVSILGGAIYGAISGALKAFFNVNEVISGIMLNWISLYVANMILKSNSTVFNSAINETYKISDSSLLPNCGLNTLFGYPNINISIFICVVLAIVLYVVINKTTFGYELRATGSNKHAAKYAGMREKINIILTMAISGALSGLAGAIFYLSGYETWKFPSSVPSLGFDGISVAFLGGLSPIGTIISSFFISYIQYGGSRLSTEFFSPEIGTTISSIIIYLCAFVSFMKYLLNKAPSKKNKEVK